MKKILTLSIIFVLLLSIPALSLSCAWKRSSAKAVYKNTLTISGISSNKVNIGDTIKVTCSGEIPGTVYIANKRIKASGSNVYYFLQEGDSPVPLGHQTSYTLKESDKELYIVCHTKVGYTANEIARGVPMGWSLAALYLPNLDYGAVIPEEHLDPSIPILVENTCDNLDFLPKIWCYIKSFLSKIGLGVLYPGVTEKCYGS